MRIPIQSLKLGYTVQIDDVIGRSGFVVGGDITDIFIEDGVAVVQRAGKPALIFAGDFYGTARPKPPEAPAPKKAG